MQHHGHESSAAHVHGTRDHTHHHAHGTGGGTSNAWRLALTLALSGGYMLAEFVGGLWTGSLALLADAGHMLSDVAALGLSLFAVWIARRPADARRTYGYYRAEILAALANGAALVAVSLVIFVEAYHRLREPADVRAGPMMAIAAGGLAVNLVSLWVLGHGHHHAGANAHNLNVRGAWLHVASDALGSVGAIVAGALVWAFGWRAADPAVSVLIGLLVIYSSWRLLAESVAVLMEATPRGIDVDAVRDALAAVPGVMSVHDLHVWTITSGMDSLSAHVVVDDCPASADQRALLTRIRGVVHDRFGIDHVTIQVEPQDFEERRTVV